MLSAFRNEIIESEKARTDLLRWKLILVAALGAVGLGITSQAQSGQTSSPTISPQLVLCLIPITCVYVDLLCKHLKIRILIISEFFQHYKDGSFNKDGTHDNDIIWFYEYEKFCERFRTVLNFEDWAQEWSSIFLSFVTIITALLIEQLPVNLFSIRLMFNPLNKSLIATQSVISPTSTAIFWSGILGLFFTIFTMFYYERRMCNFKKEAEEFRKSEKKVRIKSTKELLDDELKKLEEIRKLEKGKNWLIKAMSYLNRENGTSS